VLLTFGSDYILKNWKVGLHHNLKTEVLLTSDFSFRNGDASLFLQDLMKKQGGSRASYYSHYGFVE